MTDENANRSDVRIDQPSDASLPPNVKVLGLVSLLNDTASEVIFPLLPQFLFSVLKGNRFHLGIIEGAADSIASLLKLWSGGWSDRSGKRKRFVLIGYSLTAFIRPLIAIIIAPWQLFLVRTSDRVGKGIRTSPRDALIADSTDSSNRGRAFGFHRAMDHLGAAIGPLFAAGFLYIWPNELRTLFLLTIIPGICLLLLLMFGLKEPPAREPPKERLQLTLAPFDGNFRRFLLALLVFTLGNSSDSFLLVRASELGVPTVMLPILWCAFHIIKSASNLILGRAVDRFSPRPFIFLGWAIYTLVYLGFGLASTAWEVWALFGCYAVFYGLTEPSEKTLVANLIGPERKGLAYGWYNFSIGIATLPASMIFGALYQSFGAFIAFGWGAAMALVAVMLLFGVVDKPAAPTQASAA